MEEDMIYVLVRNAQDYDECDQMVFASTSKAAVERKHEEIIGGHRVLQRFARLVQHDMELFGKNNPPPPAPELDKLPLRPLVWRGGGWNNAYVLEHDDEIRKYNEKVEEFRQHLIQQLRTQYNFAEELLPELDNIWYHLRDNTYSVEEVESD